jgi:DNA-binding transcriptional LysR family regulator
MNIAMTRPSNESVLSAVCAGQCATAISSFAAAPYIAGGALSLVDVELPRREFFLLKHKERHLSAAACELVNICSE